MKSRSLGLKFLLTRELSAFLKDIHDLSACPSELKNEINRTLEKESTVAFSVINDCYNLTRNLPADFNRDIHIPFWRISLLTSVVFPETRKPRRDATFDAHFSELKLKYDNSYYDKMTRDVGSPLVFSAASKAKGTCLSEFKCVSKQLVMVLNFTFIVASGFAFGYFLPDLISNKNPVSLFSRIVCAFFCSLIVLFADLYFLVRNFSLLEKVYG
ncbi:unnamed protein product [Heterobilharzia americana]|nr:unnamed protein product [Heterobilharzia americana]